MKKKTKIIFITFIFLIMAFLIQVYIDANYIETSYYDIYSDKIGKAYDGTKILQLSDLHSKEFGKDSIRLIRKISEINPDIILITGDMVNATDKDFSVFLGLAQSVASKYECYYIVGNHELDLNNDDYENIMNSLKSYGITVLDNEKIELAKDNEKINLYGMWYNIRFYMGKDVLTQNVIKSIIGEDDAYNFDILLTHNPRYFEAYTNWGADLTLSGHVHGGMVRLPFVGPIFAPERTLFPRYSEGEYKMNDSSMIVSRGLGRGTNGFRLFNRPEIGVITLHSKS